MLLRPDPEVTEAILGILGRGLKLFPEINLVAYQYMSNHPHLLAAPESQLVLSKFMGFVQTKISIEVGTHIRGWPGPFWHRRYDAKPILDEGGAVSRLRYLLENSVKENLVETIEDWPGANGVHTMLTGKPNVGVWFDRSAAYEAQRHPGGEPPDLARFRHPVEVPLKPLPCWSHLSQQERSHRVRQLLDDIREEHAARRAHSRVTVLGVKGILAVDPYEPSGSGRPPRLGRGRGQDEGKGHTKPALCHASSWRLRKTYRKAFSVVVKAYDQASKAFQRGEFYVVFPAGTFRPMGGYVTGNTRKGGDPKSWIGGLSPA